MPNVGNEPRTKSATGGLYQARFKSFPVETDDHSYTVVRYVERNPLRANLVDTAEAWRWGSLRRRVQNQRAPLLTDWPLSEPRNWAEIVSWPQTEAEVNAIRRCMLR
jgi:putative transposase